MSQSIDQAVLAALAEHIRQSLAIEFQQHFQALGYDLRTGKEQVDSLTQRLNELSARFDSLERSAEADEEDDILKTASVATQQAQEFLAEMEGSPRTGSARRDTSRPFATALTPNAVLDIKYINNLVSCSVPVFKAAGSVVEAKHWVNAARSARETLATARQPPEADELFASTLANTMQGECHQWYRCTYLPSTRSESRTTEHIIAAFEQRYILSRSVQQSIRTQFMDLPVTCTNNRMSLAAVYDKMTQLLELMPEESRTSVPDQITILMRCVVDDDVRRDANRDVHTSLEDAYQAIQKAIADRAHNRHLGKHKSGERTRPPPNRKVPRAANLNMPPNPVPSPQETAQNLFTPQAFGSIFTPNTQVQAPATGVTPQQASVPVFGKLTDTERSHCLENRLCFHCRQPGHAYRDCPHRSQSKNTRGPARPQPR
jgi:hypothetical protein